MDTDWAVTVSPTFDLVLTLVNTLVMVVLIAAAVDRFLAHPEPEKEEAQQRPVR